MRRNGPGPRPVPIQVAVALTPDEAVALVALEGSIGGDPTEGAPRHAIDTALGKIHKSFGLPSYSKVIEDNNFETDGSIYINRRKERRRRGQHGRRSTDIR